MSVIAMSVRGGPSPTMLNAVRPSRTATLKDVQPRYASFPMRPASLSPTRCQNSTTPSAPAFSIMSSMRDASATSSMVRHIRAWRSHEGREDRLQVRAPFPLRLVCDGVAVQFTEALDDDREEAFPVGRGHEGGRRADLVEGHREDLVERPRTHEGTEPRPEVGLDLLVLPELLRLLELLLEEDPREPLELRADGFVVPAEDLRGDRLRLEQVAHDDRRLHDVAEDPLHLRDLEGPRRQEHEEGTLPDPGDDDRTDLELLDGHEHVLPGQLVADVAQVVLQEIQEPILAGIEIVGDRGGEDASVDPEEHRDVGVAVAPRVAEGRLEHVLEVARRLGPHRLVDLAGVGHLSAPLQPVRVEDDLEGFLRGIVVVPVRLHETEAFHDARRGLQGLRGPDGLVERLVMGSTLLLGDPHGARPHDDPDAAGEDVRVHGLPVVDPAHLEELYRAVERPADGIVLEVDRAVAEVDRKEDVLPDRLAGPGVLLDRAQDDSELLEGVEQLPDELSLLQLVLGRPDHGRHRVDDDPGRDVVVRARLDELRELLLDHLLEVLPLEVDEEQGLLVVLPHVEAHEVRFPHDLFRRFLESHVQGLFSGLDPLHEELDRERRLARAARPEDHDRGLRPEAAFNEIIEPGNPAGYLFLLGHRRSSDATPGGHGAALGWETRDDAPSFLKGFRPGNLP